MELFQLIICNKVGKMFAQCGKNVVMFSEKWLKSEINKHIIDMEPATISQGTQYWLTLLYEEAGEIPSTKEDETENAMEWLGYTLTHAQYEKNIFGRELWEKYDVVRYLGNYDTLHTLSPSVATDILLTDFSKANQAMMQVMGDYGSFV